MWIVVTGYTRERERLKVAAGALLQSEDQRTRLFQMNPDAIFLIDAETRRYLDVNEAFEHLSGWSKADVVGHTSVEFNLWVDPADRGRLYEELNARGEVRDFLCRFRRRDGSEFWGSTSVGWADIGGRRCLLLATRDVSEQLSAEKAVAESRALLSALIDSTDDFIFLVDPRTFGLTVFNDTFAKAAKDTLGVDVRPGMRMQDLLPPDIAAEWCGFYTRALAAGLFSLEYTVPGTSRILLLSLSPVRHGDEVIGVSVFGKDITNRKRAAEERERIEVQLLQAQKMESLGSLGGGVAHDFNNLRAGIMGYADLLLDDEHDSVQRERLQAILNAARRSSELTKKLLAFGRRGRNIVEPVELNAIVTDGLAMLRPSFTSSIAVVLELHGSWTVDGDPSQMNQMVLNLCINASEAMPAGGRLTIRTRDAELDAPCGHALHLKPGAYVELAIADTGAGMAGEVKERIFEPFFTTKVGGGVTGTGLGLSTVYGIVQLHQGAIAVDSTPGAGTTFTIYLPKGILRDVHLGAARPTPAGRGLILVVEDEELLRSFTAAALDRLGYSAIMAADGEEAVRVFRDRHAELTGVLLDLKMPKMGGRATFLEMADIDPRVPVLICSGYGDNEEAQGLITLGAKGLLPKPYRLADLSEQLAKLAP
jgi:PAS domain S-box-containing protein